MGETDSVGGMGAAGGLGAAGIANAAGIAGLAKGNAGALPVRFAVEGEAAGMAVFGAAGGRKALGADGGAMGTVGILGFDMGDATIATTGLIAAWGAEGASGGALGAKGAVAAIGLAAVDGMVWGATTLGCRMATGLGIAAVGVSKPCPLNSDAAKSIGLVTDTIILFAAEVGATKLGGGERGFCGIAPMG